MCFDEVRGARAGALWDSTAQPSLSFLTFVSLGAKSIGSTLTYYYSSGKVSLAPEVNRMTGWLLPSACLSQLLLLPSGKAKEAF